MAHNLKITEIDSKPEGKPEGNFDKALHILTKLELDMARQTGALNSFGIRLDSVGLKLDSWNGFLSDLAKSTQDIAEELRIGRQERSAIFKSVMYLVFSLLAMLGAILLIDKLASTNTQLNYNDGNVKIGKDSNQ